MLAMLLRPKEPSAGDAGRLIRLAKAGEHHELFKSSHVAATAKSVDMRLRSIPARNPG
jgi:hypothetical protein